jgi:hypothetical protein
MKKKIYSLFTSVSLSGQTNPNCGRSKGREVVVLPSGKGNTCTHYIQSDLVGPFRVLARALHSLDHHWGGAGVSLYMGDGAGKERKLSLEGYQAGSLSDGGWERIVRIRFLGENYRTCRTFYEMNRQQAWVGRTTL